MKTSTKSPLTEKQESDIREVKAVIEQEGGSVSEFTEEFLEKMARGGITGGQAVGKIIASHGLTRVKQT